MAKFKATDEMIMAMQAKQDAMDAKIDAIKAKQEATDAKLDAKMSQILALLESRGEVDVPGRDAPRRPEPLAGASAATTPTERPPPDGAERGGPRVARAADGYYHSEPSEG